MNFHPKVYLFILTLTSLLWAGIPLPNFLSFYKQGWMAQNRSQYPQWLASLGDPREIQRQLVTQMTQELDLLKQGTQKEREKGFEALLFYYSEANGKFKKTPLALDEAVQYSWQDLIGGNYDSQLLSQRLVAGIASFGSDVIEPILEQVEAFILTHRSQSNIFCIGRDFTSSFLFLHWRNKVPQSQLFTLNVSRAIKDLVEDKGKTAELRQLLESIGLSKEVLLEKGLFFMDSSKAGKIPRAIMRALVEPMNAEESYRFLRKCSIQYIISSSSKGDDLTTQIEKAYQKKPWDKSILMEVLDREWNIPEFSLKVPNRVKNYEPTDRHHFFEHHPKFVGSSVDFVQEGGLPFLKSNEPSSPSDRIASLMGLHADLNLRSHFDPTAHHAAPVSISAPVNGIPYSKSEAKRLIYILKGKEPGDKNKSQEIFLEWLNDPGSRAKLWHDWIDSKRLADVILILKNEIAPPVIQEWIKGVEGLPDPKEEILEIKNGLITPLPQPMEAPKTVVTIPIASPASILEELNPHFSEINAAAKNGAKKLEEWREKSYSPAEQGISKISLKSTGNANFPYLLTTPERKIRLRLKIGEGHNSEVYLSENFTAVKVSKESYNARKNMLQFWSHEKLTALGIQCPSPIWISRDALILEEQYIPSDPLEVLYGHGQPMPHEILQQILDIWKKLKAFAQETGIYFDFKSANVHLIEDRLVFVDYGPRLNKGYWNYYFADPSHSPLDEATFLDRFLHYEIRRNRGQQGHFHICRNILNHPPG